MKSMPAGGYRVPVVLGRQLLTRHAAHVVAMPRSPSLREFIIGYCLHCRYASEDDAPAAVAQEQHPGLNLHAVAVSMQAAQQPEEVVLFCGIIDFLQVGLGVGAAVLPFPILH